MITAIKIMAGSKRRKVLGGTTSFTGTSTTGSAGLGAAFFLAILAAIFPTQIEYVAHIFLLAITIANLK